MLKCLEGLSPGPHISPKVDALLIDGTTLVNMLKSSGLCKTFADYATIVCLPHIKNQLQKVKRLDVVWDRYVENSLKAQTRSKRGQGIQRRVQSDVRLPGNWSEFLRVDANKTDLFIFLADQTASIQCEEKICIFTIDRDILSNSTPDTSRISPCTQEEADTWLLLHASDCAKDEHKKLMIRTVDTDVVVLAISLLPSLEVGEMWIAFAIRKNFRHALGEEKSEVMHVFHVIKHHPFWDEVNVQPGQHGKHTEMSLMHS